MQDLAVFFQKNIFSIKKFSHVLKSLLIPTFIVVFTGSEMENGGNLSKPFGMFGNKKQQKM